MSQKERSPCLVQSAGRAYNRSMNVEVTRPARPRVLGPFVYVYFFATVFIAVATVASVFTYLFDPEPGSGFSLPLIGEVDPFRSQPRFTVAILGVDKGEEEIRRSDTLMIAFVDLPEKKVALMSIPRDSRVRIPEHGLDKINHAYAFGGYPLTKATVESWMGIPLDYHVKVDFKGFVEIVDLLGGVEVDVEKRMKYKDRSQKLTIDLQPGLQKLSGTQAMGYVRFRHDRMGDVGRIERQQKFLRLLTRQVLSPAKVHKLPAVARKVYEHVTTDIPLPGILRLAKMAREFDRENLTTFSVPGEPTTIGGISYVIPDEAFPRTVAVEFQRGFDLAFLGFEIHILNGAGRPGLAAKAQDDLLSLGIPVTRIGDAHRRYERTRLEVPPGHKGVAKKLIGLFPQLEVVEQSRPSHVATLILGEDALQEEGVEG